MQNCQIFEAGVSLVCFYEDIGWRTHFLHMAVNYRLNPITVHNFAVLFNCTPAGRASDLMMAPA